MKSKNLKTVGLVLLLIAGILSLGVSGFSCVSGAVPIGWSGTVVSNNILYIGSLEGRLVSYNLIENSRLFAEPLKMPSQGGWLSSCTSALSCSGGSSRVPIYSTPVVSGNSVYIAGYNGRIYAYNTLNLAQRWIYPRDSYLGAFVGGIVIENNRLYAGCSDGLVYCIDATTGELIGSFKTDDKIWGTPTVADNTLYIGSFDKKIYALDASTMALKWSFTTEGSVIAKPLVADGVVYVGSFDKSLYALNIDGTLKWKFDQAGNWYWTQPLIVNNMLYVANLDGYIYVLDIETGASIKVFDKNEIPAVSAISSQPVAVDNNVYFASHDGIIYKIDTTTQTLTQLAALTGTITSPLLAYEGTLYFQTEDIAMQCINMQNGAVTSISLISG